MNLDYTSDFFCVIFSFMGTFTQMVRSMGVSLHFGWGSFLAFDFLARYKDFFLDSLNTVADQLTKVCHRSNKVDDIFTNPIYLD